MADPINTIDITQLSSREPTGGDKRLTLSQIGEFILTPDPTQETTNVDSQVLPYNTLVESGYEELIDGNLITLDNRANETLVMYIEDVQLNTSSYVGMGLVFNEINGVFSGVADIYIDSVDNDAIGSISYDTTTQTVTIRDRTNTVIGDPYNTPKGVIVNCDFKYNNNGDVTVRLKADGNPIRTFNLTPFAVSPVNSTLKLGVSCVAPAQDALTLQLLTFSRQFTRSTLAPAINIGELQVVNARKASSDEISAPDTVDLIRSFSPKDVLDIAALAGGSDVVSNVSNLFDNSLNQFEDLSKGTINISRDSVLTTTPAASSFFTRYMRSNYVWSNKLYFEITPIITGNATFEMLFSLMNDDGVTEYNKGVKVSISPDGSANAFALSAGDTPFNRLTGPPTPFAINVSQGDVIGFSIDTSKETGVMMVTMNNLTKSLKVTNSVPSSAVTNNNGLDVTAYAVSNVVSSFDLNFGQKQFIGEIPDGFTPQARAPFVKNMTPVLLWVGDSNGVDESTYGGSCTGFYLVRVIGSSTEFIVQVTDFETDNQSSFTVGNFISNTLINAQTRVNATNRRVSQALYTADLVNNTVVFGARNISEISIIPF